MMYSKIKKIKDIAKNTTIKSALNAAVNQVEVNRQSSTLHSLPQTVDVVLTRICNLKCIFCKDYETLGDTYITVENFKKAARQLFPTARRLRICSGGEPYMHKQLIDLLRIAGQYKIETVLLSNGMLLKENLIRTIVSEGLISRHGFSVDGIKASTVEAIRVRAKLDVIKENIRMLARIREEEGGKQPEIEIRYALMHSNIKELPQAVRYWGEMGINRMDCFYLSLCNDIDHHESLYFHQDLMEQVFNDAREVASDYSHLTLHLPPTIHQEQPKQHAPVKCASPWSFVKVETDGRIFPCYKSWGVISMGNIYDDNGRLFKEIWNGPQYQALRRTANDDTLPKHYSYCSVCQRRFGMGNKAIHLGDETWLDHIRDTSEKAKVIASRARSR
ncbi:MAG: radical SAM protein [Deltaproteobacteria bacterium]|nr:radical SAM protein [Deltaproteobacteria bacterium]